MAFFGLQGFVQGVGGSPSAHLTQVVHALCASFRWAEWATHVEFIINYVLKKIIRTFLSVTKMKHLRGHTYHTIMATTLAVLAVTGAAMGWKSFCDDPDWELVWRDEFDGGSHTCADS
jgi:acid phosphatase family membrane protein YuiD